MKSFLSQHEFARRADADWRNVLQLIAVGVIKPAGRLNRNRLIFSPDDVEIAKRALHDAPAEVEAV